MVRHDALRNPPLPMPFAETSGSQTPPRLSSCFLATVQLKAATVRTPHSWVPPLPLLQFLFPILPPKRKRLFQCENLAFLKTRDLNLTRCVPEFARRMNDARTILECEKVSFEIVHEDVSVDLGPFANWKKKLWRWLMSQVLWLRRLSRRLGNRYRDWSWKWKTFISSILKFCFFCQPVALVVFRVKFGGFENKFHVSLDPWGPGVQVQDFHVVTPARLWLAAGRQRLGLRAGKYETWNWHGKQFILGKRKMMKLDDEQQMSRLRQCSNEKKWRKKKKKMKKKWIGLWLIVDVLWKLIVKINCRLDLLFFFHSLL